MALLRMGNLCTRVKFSSHVCIAQAGKPVWNVARFCLRNWKMWWKMMKTVAFWFTIKKKHFVLNVCSSKLSPVEMMQHTDGCIVLKRCQALLLSSRTHWRQFSSFLGVVSWRWSRGKTRDMFLFMICMMTFWFHPLLMKYPFFVDDTWQPLKHFNLFT